MIRLNQSAENSPVKPDFVDHQIAIDRAIEKVAGPENRGLPYRRNTSGPRSISFAAPRGLSLLEVLLSIAILGVSMLIISNMYFLGFRSAMKARLVSDANILCDTVMAEVAAGSIALEETNGQPFEGNPEWSYSVRVGDSLQAGLLVVTVTVQQANPAVPIPVAVSVVRFVPDPDYEPEEL